MKNLLLVLNCALVCGAAPARVPLVFEPNQGQAPSEVQFVSRGKEYQLLLYKDGGFYHECSDRS